MKRLIFVIPIVLLLVIVSTALAQSGGGASLGTGYDLTWNTIDNGGGESVGSGYALMSTIGQPDAGIVMNGGGYSLAGGFWNEEMNRYRVYLPVVIT